HQGRDDAAFAVADEADLPRIDFPAALEELDAGEHIDGEIGRGRIRDATGRAADAAVVDTADGDTAAGQVIGQDQERLVTQDGLVPVLRSGTGDEEHGGKWSPGTRHRQGPGQLDAGFLVFISNLDF